jgi:hypothetical protein
MGFYLKFKQITKYAVKQYWKQVNSNLKSVSPWLNLAYDRNRCGIISHACTDQKGVLIYDNVEL